MVARIYLLLLVTVALIIDPAAAAGQDGRVALVIGNSAYQHGARLRNPSNDAAAIAEVLGSIGFDLIGPDQSQGPLFDAEKRDMEQALRTFRQRSRDAKVSFFYFAGHGIQYQNQNYLLPIDAYLRDPQDIPLDTVLVEAVLAQMKSDVNIIVLDACRENPFADVLQSNGLVRGASGTRGFARVDQNALQGGSLLAMAAAPGAFAEDGTRGNSPYATALMRHLATPDVSVRLLFARVREAVEQTTDGRQRPEAIDRLPSREVFLVAQRPPDPPPNPTPPVGSTPQPRDPSSVACDILYRSENPRDFQAYIDQFPNGVCVQFAHFRLRALMPEPTARDDRFADLALGRQHRLDLLQNDSDAVRITDLGTPQAGTATISADGRALLFTPPDQGPAGTSFSYQVEGRNGTRARGTVTVAWRGPPAPPPRVTPAPSRPSQPTIQILDGIDFDNSGNQGLDIQMLRRISHQDCQNACLRNTNCAAYTYNTRFSACFLKRGIAKRVSFRGAISGLVEGRSAVATRTSPPQRPRTPRFEILRNIDLPGNDLHHRNGRIYIRTSQSQCQTLCVERRDCAAYTYNANNRACFLKSRVSSRTRFNGAVSGVISR